MPVNVIGMIGVAPPQGTALHVIAGGISPTFLREFSQAHEAAGFDYVLVGYYASSAEGFNVASYAACQTKTLSFLIAHRPGVVAPTIAARAAATLDQLSGGRLALHIIVGNSDADQQREGDFSPKEERYQRAAEYLERDAQGLDLDQAVRLRGQVLPLQGCVLRSRSPSSSPIRRCSSAAPRRARWRWARSTAMPSRCSASRWRRRPSGWPSSAA